MDRIEKLRQGIIDNYNSMIKTCDHYIKHGIDVKWFQKAKQDCLANIEKLKSPEKVTA